MRVSFVLAGMAALTSTVAAEPSIKGLCLDDFNCFVAGGTCVKAQGAVLGTCSVGGTTHPPFGFPTTFKTIPKVSEPTIWKPSTTHKPTISGIPGIPKDIGAIAARVATRTDVPEHLAAFARDVVARHPPISHAPTISGIPHWPGQQNPPHWPGQVSGPHWPHGTGKPKGGQ